MKDSFHTQTKTNTHTQTQSHPNRFSPSLSLFIPVCLCFLVCLQRPISRTILVCPQWSILSLLVCPQWSILSLLVCPQWSIGSLDWSALSGPVDASSSVCACGTSLKHYRISGLSLKVLGCGLQGFEGPWEASGCVGACKVICWCESFLEITKCCGTWAPKGVRLYIHIYRVFKVWGRAFVDSGLSFLLRISALRVYTIGF